MFGKILKGKFLLSFLMVTLLISTSYASDDKGDIESKVDAVLNFWGFSQDEYQAAIKLNKYEAYKLKKLRADKNSSRKKNSIDLLLTVNCIDYDEKEKYIFLYQYLCEKGTFDDFSSSAISSIDGLYQLIFVKDKDLKRTIEFVKRYYSFWLKEDDEYGQKFGLPTDSKEYLLEIINHLEIKLNKKGN